MGELKKIEPLTFCGFICKVSGEQMDEVKMEGSLGSGFDFFSEEARALHEWLGRALGLGLALDLERENNRLRLALTGISTCSTCEVCRNVARNALEAS